MTRPPEVGYVLRLHALRRASSRREQRERSYLVRLLLYYQLARELAVTWHARHKLGEVDPIEITRNLVALAAVVGDPLGIREYYAAYLDLHDCLSKGETRRMLYAARATLSEAEKLGVSGQAMAEVRLVCQLAVKRYEKEHEIAELETIVAEVETGIARFDGMTADEQQGLGRQANYLTQRTAQSGRLLRDVRARKVPLRGVHRNARKSSRRASRRTTPSRAHVDAGGDGDAPGDPGDGSSPNGRRASNRYAGRVGPALNAQSGDGSV